MIGLSKTSICLGEISLPCLITGGYPPHGSIGSQTMFSMFDDCCWSHVLKNLEGIYIYIMYCIYIYSIYVCVVYIYIYIYIRLYTFTYLRVGVCVCVCAYELILTSACATALLIKVGPTRAEGNFMTLRSVLSLQCYSHHFSSISFLVKHGQQPLLQHRP